MDFLRLLLLRPFYWETPRNKNWPGQPIWQCVGLSRSQVKRDKGYVLEQISAAKKKKKVLFCFVPSSSSTGLYIYSAIGKKGKVSSSSLSIWDCITEYRAIPSLWLCAPRLYTRGYIYWSNASHSFRLVRKVWAKEQLFLSFLFYNDSTSLYILREFCFGLYGLEDFGCFISYFSLIMMGFAAP